MPNKYFIVSLISFLFLIFACTQQPGQSTIKIPAPSLEKVVEKTAPVPSTQGTPVLKIISPKDNELIKASKVIVELQAENFELVPVGQPVKDGQGHFHVWLDSEKKLGPQKAFTFENVVSGKHAIVAELVKSDHSSLSPKITKAIAINVESDFVPKVEQPQAGASDFTVEADDNGFYPDKIQAKIGAMVKINFKFRDSSIYFAGLDIKGPFPTLHYKLNGQQPLTASFEMKEPSRIDSYWPSSGVHKATLNVEVAK